MSDWLSVNLSVCLSVLPSVCLAVWLSVCLSVCLSFLASLIIYLEEAGMSTRNECAALLGGNICL